MKTKLDILKEKIEKMKDCPTNALILKDIKMKQANETKLVTK